MTRDQTKAAAQVMLAFAEGQEVQYRSRTGICPHEWAVLLASCPEWNWEVWDYRVKPVPREWWVWLDGCERIQTLTPGTDSHDVKRIKVREVLD